MYARRILAFASSGAAFFAFAIFSAHAQTVDTWDARAVAPWTVNAIGNRLVYPGSGDLIYGYRGDDASFAEYSISGDAWTARASSNCGAAIDNGSVLVAGGSGFIYASCPTGNGTTDWVRYTIATNSWENRATSPFTPVPIVYFNSGAAAVYDGTQYIYALAGGGNTPFARYDTAANSWTSMAAAPAGISSGGSLAYPGSGDYIYALRGNVTKTVYRYTISSDTWGTLAGVTPENVEAGGAFIYGGNLYYAFRGASGVNDFWSYNASTDAWAALTPAAVASVTSGAAFAYVSNASGKFLYAFYGNSSNNFYRYTISLAASTSGGSAGSRLLLFRQDEDLALARATPPAPPTNVTAKPTSCNGTCGAELAFSYVPLGVHQGRPLTFAFVNESGETLGSVYEPSAGIKSYILELKNLAANSPLNGRLCAQFGSGSGCANVQGWTLFGIDPGKVKLSAEIDGDSYRARVRIPAYPNEGVEFSGVRMEITADGKKVSVETLKKSGEAAVTLPPGNYAFIFTPINARGVLGAPVMLPLTLKPFGEALTLDVGARVADKLFIGGFGAASSRLGNNGFELLLERRGEALQFIADNGTPVEVRMNLTATLVPPHTTKVNGAVAFEKEQFTFVFLCTPGDACKSVSSLAQKGNVATRAVDIREGLATTKTLDAIVTANMNGALAYATVNVIGKELSGLEGTLEFPASRLRGGEGAVAFTVADALGNKIAKSASINIAGAPARIMLFDIAALTESEAGGDVVARAIVDYRDFAERVLLLNLSFAEEAAITTEPIHTVPRLVQLLMTRDDGTGVQFALSCEESCGIAAVAAPSGATFEVLVEKNPDGTARASAGGVTLTYDAQNALPMLVGADKAGFARAELRTRYASFGFGNKIGELRANEATARAAFAGTGGYLNLFPEVIERVILDLAPLIINYFAPENSAPVIESVRGARMESRSRPVQILNEVSTVGAPVSPLLNTLRNLLVP